MKQGVFPARIMLPILLFLVAAGASFGQGFVFHYGMGYSFSMVDEVGSKAREVLPDTDRLLLPLGISALGGMGYEFGEEIELEDGTVKEPQLILGIEGTVNYHTPVKERKSLMEVGSQLRLYFQYRPVNAVSFAIYAGYGSNFFRNKNSPGSTQYTYTHGPVVGGRMNFYFTRVTFDSLLSKNKFQIDQADWGMYLDANVMFSKGIKYQYEFGAGFIAQH